MVVPESLREDLMDWNHQKLGHPAATRQYKTMRSAFDRERLCRYPQPREVVHDQGREFTGAELQEFLRSYGIKAKPITARKHKLTPFVNACISTCSMMLEAMAMWTGKFSLLCCFCSACKLPQCTKCISCPSSVWTGHDLTTALQSQLELHV